MSGHSILAKFLEASMSFGVTGNDGVPYGSAKFVVPMANALALDLC